MNRVTFYAGGLRFELETETADDLQTQAAELASSAPKTIESLAAVVQAGLAVEAFKKDTSGTVPPKPPVNRGTQPGKSDVPNCKCGIPMTDVRGKTYKTGAKQGQPYDYSFYRSNDCKAKCEAVK